jgi:hypothetical protein
MMVFTETPADRRGQSAGGPGLTRVVQVSRAMSNAGRSVAFQVSLEQR